MGGMNRDYYGNGFKWFTGVVKDVSDPKAANRVRVRIHGINPEDTLDQPVSGGDTTPSSGSGGGSSSSASGGSTTPGATATTGSSSASLGQLQGETIDSISPGTKLSNHFKLDDLVRAQYKAYAFRNGLLTKTHAQNLSALCKNALDAIVDQKGTIHIHDGWRPKWVHSSRNHTEGYAADIDVSGMDSYHLACWIRDNLHGRYNFLINEYSGGSSWVHVQLGTGSGQGSTSSPLLQTMQGQGNYVSGIQPRR